MNNKVRFIAFYLPQYHPIPENDEWWGKGFTEWTNVGRAKALFRGHEQPKVPKDLGYYDLRVEETRIQQAALAREAGIEGFCYWHYWFGNGKRLLERPFNEVLESGKPEFPFCLGWANHSWKLKMWSPTELGNDKVLIEQTYPGKEDIVAHFYSNLKAFKDPRYIRVNNKPLFLIWDTEDLPNSSEFIRIWNDLAVENGFDGIYFVGFTFNNNITDDILLKGFDAVCLDYILKTFKHINIIKNIWDRFKRKVFSHPFKIKYDDYSKHYLDKFPNKDNVLPCIYPNFDHTSRSGKYGTLLEDSTPAKFCSLLENVLKIQNCKDNEGNKLVFIKSWNEWGEGNYLEPDLINGDAYIKEMKNKFGTKQ